MCPAILKAAGSSAKGLITHLKSQHEIAVKSSRVEVAKIDEPKLKIRKIDSFFKSEKQSLGELVSQLTAIDGLTFNQIATSERLSRAFKADGYDLPRSHKKVRDLVMKQKEDIVKTIRGELNAIKLRDGRFSITFDEATSMRNGRYMNINVHFQGGFRSLGLVRIQGSLNAAKAIKLVEERLQLFDLNLNKVVVATITDGASLMVKFGRDTFPEHVICYAHAIHLAVCDVLYKKPQPQHKPSEDFIRLVDHCESDTENDSIAEGEDDSDEEETDNAVPLASNLQNVVQKVRKIVTLFRRSPVKNDDNLQPYILENFGREKMLLLDCKTRWNSLLTMLDRFYELKKEIKMAMVQLDVPFDLSDKEMKEINEMCEALALFKVAVNALASEDADMLLSEKIIAFVLKKLGELQSNISKELIQRFSVRIGERCNDHLVHLFEYLKKSSYINQPEDHLGHKIGRQKIAAMATTLIQKLFVSNGSDEVASNKEEEVTTNNTNGQETQTQMTLAQELYAAFVADDKNEEQCINVSSRVVQKEMMLYEIT